MTLATQTGARTRRFGRTIRGITTDVGCYEIAYITADGACLCDACTLAEFRNCAEAIRDNDFWSGWAIGATTHEGETDEQVDCDHCGRTIFEGY